MSDFAFAFEDPLILYQKKGDENEWH